MKKLSFLLAAILILCMALPVMAEGGDINAAEQAILDELKKGTSNYSFSADEIKQAENYFKTVDVTAEESAQVIASVEEAYEIVKAHGGKISSVKDLSATEKKSLLNLAKKATAVVGLTLTYTGDSHKVNITTASGETVFAAEAVIKTTGAVNDFSALLISLSVVAITGMAMVIVSKKKIQFSK